MRKDKRITILEQIDHQTYRLNDDGHSLVLTAHICPCRFMKQMGFPCRHIFKLRSYLCLPLFDAKLVNERWTVEYYKTLSHTRFPPPQAKDKCTNLNVALSEAPPETKKATLAQEQKNRDLLKTTHQLAPTGSEGGMKVYSQCLSILQKILHNWLMGKEVQLKEHVSDSKEPFQDEDNFCHFK